MKWDSLYIRMKSNIVALKRDLSFLNKVFWIGFYSKKWVHFINQKKIHFVINSIGKEIQPIIDRYQSYKIPNTKIGNRVWVFWYTGIENAPPIVKKCIEQMQIVKDIDLKFIDKENLNDYFEWDSNIKLKFEAGAISVTLLSDIIRNQLLSRYGGFWLDATILVLDKNFILNHKDLSFYSVRHQDYAACTHFNDGKWSSFLSGMPKGHPLASFSYDFFVWYFSEFDMSFDYFMIDYIYMFAYLKFTAVRKQIDSLTAENEDVFIMGRNIRKSCSKVQWNHVIDNNHIQKLIWKIDGNKISRNKKTYFSCIMAYPGDNDVQ